jgi:hypothetical protein
MYTLNYSFKLIASGDVDDSALQVPKATVRIEDYLYSNGSIAYFLYFELNLEELILGLDEDKQIEVAKNAKSTIAAIDSLYSEQGYSTHATTNTITITLMSYDSYTDYYIANGIDGYDDSGSSATVKSEFFYKTYYSIIKNPFSASNRWWHLTKSLEYIASLNSINEDEIIYYYVYGTKYSLFHISLQSNAEPHVEFDVTNDIYIHTLKFAQGQYDDIIVVNKVPNSVGWYIIVLIVAAILIAIMVIIIKRKKKGDSSPGSECEGNYGRD